MLSCASDKAKLLKSFLRTYIPMTYFPRTNIRRHNILLTPKIAENFIIDLDFLKASGPDFIPVVVLSNYEPQLPYIPADLFSMCLKESYLPNCWHSHLCSLCKRMMWEGLRLEGSTLNTFYLLEKLLKSSHWRCFLKMCFEKFHKTYRRAPVLDPLF